MACKLQECREAYPEERSSGGFQIIGPPHFADAMEEQLYRISCAYRDTGILPYVQRNIRGVAYSSSKLTVFKQFNWNWCFGAEGMLKFDDDLDWLTLGRELQEEPGDSFY